jgi:hypothetical protein
VTGEDDNTLHTVTIEAGTGMVMIEGQGIIINTVPWVIYPSDHWFRGVVVIPRSHRVEID